MRANTAREAKALGLCGSRRARSSQYLATFALLFTLLTAQTPVALAQSAATGHVYFQGIADLPIFPCVPGPCRGEFDGRATGGASGVDNGVPWTISFADGSMEAIFSYANSGICPGSGRANGSFTISGGTGTYGGVQGAASITGTFTWERTGTAANILAVVKIKIGAREFTKSGRAAATFVPLRAAHCDAPGPMQAAVAGSLVISP